MSLSKVDKILIGTENAQRKYGIHLQPVQQAQIKENDLHDFYYKCLSHMRETDEHGTDTYEKICGMNGILGDDLEICYGPVQVRDYDIYNF